MLTVLLVAPLNGCTTNPADEGATQTTRVAIGTCPGEPVPSELTVTCHRVEVEGASISVALLHAPTPPETLFCSCTAVPVAVPWPTGTGG